MQWYADLSFSALLAYTSTLLIHFQGNFFAVRLVDQWKRQMEIKFYSRWCIMGSGVGILAKKITLAMTVVVESWITHCSLDSMVWKCNFHSLDYVFPHRGTFLIRKCACLCTSLNTLIFIGNRIFKQSTICRIFCRSIIVVLQVTLKLVNFYYLIFHNTTLNS